MKCLAILTLVFLAVIVASVQVAASPAHLEKQGAYYFVVGPSSLGEPGKASATLGKMDINGDGKVETLKLLTTFGTSRDAYVLKIFSSSGKLLAKIAYNSSGDCAIGSLFPVKKAKQLIVWNARITEDESNMAPHYYETFIYDWTSSGKLIQAYYYPSRRKYSYISTDSDPFPEFLKHRGEIVSLLDLKPKKIIGADYQQITKKVAKRKDDLRRKVCSAHRIACWAIVVVEQPNNPDNQVREIWQKKSSQWEELNEIDSPGEYGNLCAMYGIPYIVLDKLL